MTQFRANHPRFVDETVDGEALIMDMVTGTYYTCLGPSTVAWEALKRGVDTHEVAAMISSTYPVALADAERDVQGFVDELVRDEMLVAWTGSAPSPEEARVAVNGTNGEYQSLSLERYTDLADLILLDPVHDVTEVGWPHETT